MNLGGSIRINKCSTFIVFLVFVFIVHYLAVRRNSASQSVAGDSNEINLRKLLIGSIQAAQAGGAVVLKVSKTQELNVKSKGKTKEGKDEYVTEADFQSHCLMQTSLKRIFPRLQLRSEESHSDDRCSDDAKYFDLDPTVLNDKVFPDEVVPLGDVTVWIDPLDATQGNTHIATAKF